MNVTMLIGRLVKDAELKYTAGSGIAVSKITLAVDNYNSKTGEKGADFIPVVLYNKNAENVAQYTQKGSQIAIEGRIKTGSYDAKDGTKRYTTEVIASKVQFLSKSNGASRNYNSDTGFDDGMTPVDDGDLPF